MRRITIVCAVVLFAMSSVGVSQAQEMEAGSQMSAPAASRSQSDCTGFIASPGVPRDLQVLGGGDDDFHSVVRQFVQGDSIFIFGKTDNLAVGAEYRVVRPADDLFATTRYSGERWDVRKLGKPYEDVGQVRVTHVNPEGIVAKVTFSCASIIPGDTLIPFQPRPIPEYTISGPLDHFAPLDSNRKQGRITASRNNYGFFGNQSVVYLNLGEGDGAKPGQRYRIYKVLAPHSTGSYGSKKTPPETIGEAVVLSVEPKSCVAMVVSSYREISAGDYVEAE